MILQIDKRDGRVQDESCRWFYSCIHCMTNFSKDYGKEHISFTIRKTLYSLNCHTCLILFLFFILLFCHTCFKSHYAYGAQRCCHLEYIIWFILDNSTPITSMLFNQRRNKLSGNLTNWNRSKNWDWWQEEVSEQSK